MPPVSIINEASCLRHGGELAEGLAELERHLEQQNSLPPIPLRRPRDVLLSVEGVVQRRYKFTHKGLSSLCARLVQGLPGTISRLSGLLAQESGPTPRPDLAVRILNTLITELFDDRLREWRLVVDPIQGSIEGVVSPRYEHLSNADWLASCQDFVIRYVGSQRATYLESTLAGRKMLVRFVDSEPWLTVRTPDGAVDEYRRGWSFSNSETGDAAARVGFLIVDEHGNSAMKVMGRSTHTKVLRQTRGQELLNKLKLASDKVNKRVLQQSLLELHRQPLHPVESMEELTVVSTQLISQLARRIPRHIARAVVSSTMTPHDYSQPLTVPARVSPGSLSTADHSRYHLYYALTNHARSCFPREQENTEQLAYLLLRNKLPLSD